MATSKSQRITIWVIAAMMAFGSVGFYFLIIINNNDIARQRAELQSQLESQAKPAAALPGYKAETFDAAAVTKLVQEDLKVGKGETVAKGATVSANYMGWLPDGTIFDSSNRSGTPTPVSFPLSGVIAGWTNGVPGMKEGGVRKLVIPAEQAYGEQGSPPTIPPNTPLTFIIELVSIEKAQQ